MSLDSRYGIERFPEVMPRMTRPRVVRDKLMLLASRSLSPVAPLIFALSLPVCTTLRVSTIMYCARKPLGTSCT